MNLVIPLSKIDEEQRLVIGTGAAEELDRSKEIFDYASGKQAFQEWSDGMAKASNGLSKGNLRSMHRRDIAAGKIVDLGFDDDGKKVTVCAKVVDDQEWAKVLSGVYTGFSIGGGYAKRWPDPQVAGATRYTPAIREISLVDMPCIPSATVAELVKVDGSVVELPLVGAPPPTFGELVKAIPPTFGGLHKAQILGKPRSYSELKDSPRA